MRRSALTVALTLLASPEITALSPGDGWADGGCGVLAMAWTELLGLQDALLGIVPLADAQSQWPDIAHVVVEVVPGQLLDAAGLTDEDELLDRWEREAEARGEEAVAYTLVYVSRDQIEMATIDLNPRGVAAVVERLSTAVSVTTLRAELNIGN